MSDNFQILVPGVGSVISVIFPLATTAKRGAALSYSTFNGAEQPTAKLASSARATGTLTGTANFANAETVTIGTKTYTFQTTLTNVDGNVLVGGTLAASITNLQSAINLGSGSGTTYAAATTAHPTVTCSAVTATTLTARAISAGTAGNSIATTETGANASWGGATLSGGGDSDKAVFGLLTRDVTAAGGPTDTDQFFGKGLEYPDKAGVEVTADPLPDLFVAEGPDVLEQTDNPILLASTIGSILSFVNGKLHLPYTGEHCFYQLVSTSATTKDSANTLRVIVQKLNAPKVA